MRPAQRTDQAFTLTEMVVAAGAISVLMGLLLPALSAVRETGRRTRCMGNVRQLALATDLYREDNHDWYPPAWTGDARWMDLLKDDVEEPEVFDCPSSAHLRCLWDPEVFLAYGMNVFNFGGRCLWYGIPGSEVQVPSRTILLGDSDAGKYYVGGGARFRDPVRYVAYRHRKKFVAVFFDAHSECLGRTDKELWALAKQLD